MRKLEPNSSNYCNIIFPSTALKAEKSQRTFCMYRSGGCGRTWSDVPSNSRQRNWTEEVSINLQVLGYRVRLERIRTWYEEIGKLYCHATGGSSKRSPFRILSSYFFLLLFLFSLLLLVVIVYIWDVKEPSVAASWRIGHFRVPQASVFKQGQVRSHWYENEFLFSSIKTHFP